MAVKQVTIVSDEIQLNMLPVDWSFAVKEDWQNKTDGLSETAEVANEANVSADDQRARNDEQDISIEKNTESIKEVGFRLAQVSSDVSDNTIAIQANTDNIAQVTTDLSDHESASTAHGSTGEIVGTDDYCTEILGGTVNLAALIADLTPVSISVASAPAAYDQAYAQQQTDAINSLATSVNDIITKVNAILDGQKTAKQMSDV